MKLSTAKWLTVEPAILVQCIALQIAQLADVNLILQKACHPELTEQPQPDLKCDNEASAQQTVTDINVWKSILESVLTSLFIIFIGQWSDTHGKRRRPMMIIPVIGELITLLLALLSVYFWTLSPQLTALLSAFRSLTGGGVCFAAGCLIYVSDVTTEEERTMRIGFMGSAALLGSPIGSILASFLRPRLNFYGTYIVCIVMYVIVLILIYTFVKNVAVEDTKLNVCEGVFYPKNLIESFKTLVKKRQNSKHIVIILMFTVLPLFAAMLAGEYSVLYLYARYRFHMEEGQYGYYAAYRRVSIVVGLALTLLVFCKLMKLSDAMVGLIASVTMIISGVVNSLTQNTWQLIVFPLLDLMGAAVAMTSRSILTKAVDPHEYGKINSLQGAMESFIPMLAVPMFSKFYNQTRDSMPGAFFLINSCISCVMLCFFVAIMHIEGKESLVNSKSLQTENGIQLSVSSDNSRI